MEAGQRLLGIQAWLNDAKSSGEVQEQVVESLGQKTDEKVEAVQVLADIMQGYVFGKGDDGADILKRHKEKAKTNVTLGALYEGNWLYETFENACGFGYLPSLDCAIRISGGDESCQREWLSCGGALRHVFPNDPLRYTTAQAYLWGLQAYLQGQDMQWLRESKPGLAAGAKKALYGVSLKTEDTPAKCWITASLLKAIKIQLEHVLNVAETVPPEADDLPDVVEGLQEAAARFGL
jgi:hypothetical protein